MVVEDVEIEKPLHFRLEEDLKHIKNSYMSQASFYQLIARSIEDLLEFAVSEMR